LVSTNHEHLTSQVPITYSGNNILYCMTLTSLVFTDVKLKKKRLPTGLHVILSNN